MTYLDESYLKFIKSIIEILEISNLRIAVMKHLHSSKGFCIYPSVTAILRGH